MQSRPRCRGARKFEAAAIDLALKKGQPWPCSCSRRDAAWRASKSNVDPVIARSARQREGGTRTGVALAHKSSAFLMPEALYSG